MRGMNKVHSFPFRGGFTEAKVDIVNSASQVINHGSLWAENSKQAKQMLGLNCPNGNEEIWGF